MNGGPRDAAESTPQLRTILLTDLVDSTGLVERMGDVPASELFREHDRLVLELQQRWRGRLIDRSDGLLLLFERAIDGLGFALDYTLGLRTIGTSRGIDLQARSGLHVGEVLSWKNSDEAVQLGAKQVEVEGLAKPMAARLMTMARPGQILVSAMAEPLARRAALELGPRGQNLLWKSYGRWRFKGIPEAHEVHEVGEVGVAPLRVPSNGAKAWRDIPLWRRPAALAAQVLLLVGLGVGGWLLTRPQPAIAFAERDWVVVADLRNLTGQSVLDDSLEQAFRISLEQSRYVNVLSDMKARDTLARMQRPAGTLLDRTIASEIAIRDGARAVILPTVSEVGGRVRVSAEVIDPHTQATVYAESADGNGVASTLGSIDQVTAALREKLGEAIKWIEKDSVPLPQATTSSLDALRAYALGVKALNDSQNAESLRLFQQAIKLDPGFALAEIGLARNYLSAGDPDSAIPHIQRAIKHGERLTRRDALYAEAWAATLGPVHPMLEKWRLLSTLYPDYYASHMNYALWGWLYANQYEEGIPGLRSAAAAKTNPHRWVYAATLARIEIGLEQYQAAQKSINWSRPLDTEIGKNSSAILLAVNRRYVEVNRILAARKEKELATADALESLFDISVAVDQGMLDLAARRTDDAMPVATKADEQVALLYDIVALQLDALSGRHDEVRSKSGGLIAKAREQASRKQGLSKAHALFMALTVGHVSARINDIAGVEQALSIKQQEVEELGYPNLSQMYHLVLAEKMLLAGQAAQASAALRAQLNGHELYQTRAALLEANLATNDSAGAMEQATWLAGHRGRAYVEWNSYQLLQPMNIADSNLALLQAAEAAKRLGRDDLTQQFGKRFLANWPKERLPGHLRRRVDALTP